jgi:hypothetical protein
MRASIYGLTSAVTCPGRLARAASGTPQTHAEGAPDGRPLTADSTGPAVGAGFRDDEPAGAR